MVQNIIAISIVVLIVGFKIYKSIHFKGKSPRKPCGGGGSGCSCA